MRLYQGTGIVKGAAIGKVFVYQAPKWEDGSTLVEDVRKEWQRYQKAADKASQTLEQRRQQALDSLNEAQAGIFEAQQMMLEDEDFAEQIKEVIESESRSAVSAVMEVSERFAQIFLQMDSDIMKSKAADMRDIATLVIRFLQDRQELFQHMPDHCIVLADKLLPGELAEMDSEKVLGLVLREGSANSHLSILATGRSLPLLICPSLDIQAHWNGMEAGMDCDEGCFYLNIDESTSISLRGKFNFKETQSTVRRQEPSNQATAKGFSLCVNIGHPKELTENVLNACEGVGVFRSEFQYIGKQMAPSEKELFEDYRHAAELLKGKILVIRTIDIGADKPAEFLRLPSEANPALGCRGIRLCLKHKDLFICQLRAILRASAYGKISILLPMINDAEEIRESKAILREVKQSLDKEHIAYDKDIPLGIMIETPAAVLTAEVLAKEADFFSVGSNDLTQYCLAVDRDNPAMESAYNAAHPAMLKLLKITAEAAADAGIGLCICGELAHHTDITQTLVDFGFRQFSVSPAFIPLMKKQLALCKR